MFYIKRVCPVCQQGAIGFRTCSDGKSVVLVSDECDATWKNPNDITAQNAFFLQSPAFFIEEIGCNSGGPGTHWATMDEIREAGFGQFIAGEAPAINEGCVSF